MILPMLQEREPAPIIDVTKPALPKTLHCALTVTEFEQAASKALEALPLVQVAVDLGKPGADKTVAVKWWYDHGAVHVKYVEPIEFYPEPVTQTAWPDFKPGDKVMVYTRIGDDDPVLWHPRTFAKRKSASTIEYVTPKGIEVPIGADKVRRPILDELLDHWPESVSGKVKS